MSRWDSTVRKEVKKDDYRSVASSSWSGVYSDSQGVKRQYETSTSDQKRFKLHEGQDLGRQASLTQPKEPYLASLTNPMEPYSAFVQRMTTAIEQHRPRSNKVGVLPTSFPWRGLSQKEMVRINDELLMIIFKHRDGSVKPMFSEPPQMRQTGWMDFNCGDAATAAWMKSLTLWEEHGCKVIDEAEYPWRIIFNGHFHFCSDKPNEFILKRIATMNKGLNTYSWKVVKRRDRNFSAMLNIELDDNAAAQLRFRKFMIGFNLKGGKIRLKPAYVAAPEGYWEAVDKEISKEKAKQIDQKIASAQPLPPGLEPTLEPKSSEIVEPLPGSKTPSEHESDSEPELEANEAEEHNVCDLW